MNHYRLPVLADVYGDVYGLRYAAEQYPEVPLIIAHMGKFLGHDGAMRQTVLWLVREYPNLYFDTSSVGEHERLARVKVLELPAEQEAMVLGGTISRLLNWK